MNTIISATSSIGPLKEIAIRKLEVFDHAANSTCETRDVEYELELQEIAPGLLMVPGLRCGNCGAVLRSRLVLS